MANANTSSGMGADTFIGSRPIKWGWVLAYGILLILVAGLFIANPVVTGLATGFILGFVLCVYGIASIVAGVTALSTRARWTEIILGLIALAAGVYVIIHPLAGALTLVWVTGVWLLIAGVFEIVFALKSAHDKAWRLFMGALDVILGLLLVFSGPATGIAFLAFMVAISFFMRGVFMIMVALGLRRIQHRHIG